MESFDLVYPLPLPFTNALVITGIIAVWNILPKLECFRPHIDQHCNLQKSWLKSDAKLSFQQYGHFMLYIKSFQKTCTVLKSMYQTNVTFYTYSIVFYMEKFWDYMNPRSKNMIFRIQKVYKIWKFVFLFQFWEMQLRLHSSREKRRKMR